MATKEEWKEYFELTEGRKPTIEEFTQAMKSGEIDSGNGQERSRAEQSRAEQSRAEQSRAEQSRAEQSNITGSLASKRKKKKWILALVGVLVVLGIGGGIFGYVNYQKSQLVSSDNIKTYLDSAGYSDQSLNTKLIQSSNPEMNLYFEMSEVSDIKNIFSDDDTSLINDKNLIGVFNKNKKEAYFIFQVSRDCTSKDIDTMLHSNISVNEFPLKKGDWIIYKANQGNSSNLSASLLTNLSQIPAAK